MKPLRHTKESYLEHSKLGDKIIKQSRKLGEQLLENDEDLNLAKTAMLLQGLCKIEATDGEITTDGDQTPVKGFESQALRMMWSEGGDYSPLTNAHLSQWSKDCYNGNLEEIKKKVAGNPKIIESRESTLHMAALHHVIAGARTINPIPSNAKKIPKRMCVTVNDGTDHVGSIKYLLEKGARVEAKDVAGHTPLHHCVTSMANVITLKIAEILLTIGKANVNSVNRFGSTPLFEPVMVGRKDSVDLLVKHGANLNVIDNDGVNLMQIIKCVPFISKNDKMMSDAMTLHAKAEKKAAQDQGVYRVCSICKSTKDSKRCARCHMKWYCSVACQQSDWDSHKKQCKQVYNEYEEVLDQFMTKEDPKNLTNFASKGPSALIATTTKSKTQFIVKVQVNAEDLKKNRGKLDEDTKDFELPILIYNKDRSICFYMSKNCPMHKSLTKEIIKSGVGGMKGYFSAVKEGYIFKINYKRIQVPEVW